VVNPSRAVYEEVVMALEEIPSPRPSSPKPPTKKTDLRRGLARPDPREHVAQPDPTDDLLHPGEEENPGPEPA
jgi:hypothetical protein